ncbi:hypothetical protein ACS0PU_009510 [Formica fusca]
MLLVGAVFNDSRNAVLDLPKITIEKQRVLTNRW